MRQNGVGVVLHVALESLEGGGRRIPFPLPSLALDILSLGICAMQLSISLQTSPSGNKNQMARKALIIILSLHPRSDFVKKVPGTALSIVVGNFLVTKASHRFLSCFVNPHGLV